MKKCWLLCMLLMLCGVLAACGDEDFPSDVVDSQVDSEEGPSEGLRELSRVREHITSARFRCELDRRLARLFSQCSLFAADRSRMEDEVHKAYSEMQMLLGES